MFDKIDRTGVVTLGYLDQPDGNLVTDFGIKALPVAGEFNSMPSQAPFFRRECRCDEFLRRSNEIGHDPPGRQGTAVPACELHHH